MGALTRSGLMTNVSLKGRANQLNGFYLMETFAVISLTTNVSIHHIETSQLICSANYL